MNIFLSSHTLRVSKKKSSKDSGIPEYYKLDNIPVNNTNNDLFDFLRGFFQKHHQKAVNNTQQQTYMMVDNFKTENRVLFGIISSGIYGVPSVVLDSKTSNIAYKKKKTDADILPFYFLISIPPNTDEGVVLLQRFGNYGCQTNLNHFLQKSFHPKFSSCILSLNNLMLDEIVKKAILSGSIKELKCVKYKAPIDIVDGLDKGHSELFGNLEFSVKAKGIPISDRIKEFFNKDRPVNELVEIQNFSYDTVKLDVEINGNTYYYDLGNIGKMRQSLNITNDIILDADGSPVFDSIHKRAVEYLNEINSFLYK